MFKVGDIVKLKNFSDEEPENYGIVFEIKPKTKYPWNIKVMFFGTSEFKTECWGAYADHNLIKVSK
jgi:hypothetical protein